MKYIICDDEQSAAEFLSSSIKKLRPQAETLIYNSASALAFDMEDLINESNILFMDIQLKKENGIEVAIELSQKHPSLRIIYVTGFGEKYSQSIFECPKEASPVAFIVKPITDRYLENALRKAEEIQNSSIVSFRKANSLIFVNLNELIYVTCNKRILTIKATSESTELYGKLSDYENKLPRSMIRCHKSYIINASQIKKIDHWSIITMSDGTEIPIGRKYSTSFKKALTLIGASVFRGEL